MITSPYVGQRVRYIGTSGVARVTRWKGTGATMLIWVRYTPNGSERKYSAGELEAYRPASDARQTHREWRAALR